MPASGSVDYVEVPRAVLRVAAGRAVQPVWQNEVGGLTFKVLGGMAPVFVKWQPAGANVDLAAEAERLEWAGLFTPVPSVLGSGEDEEGEWLVTTEVPGQSAVSRQWRADPASAARAIGEGLRAFHSLPVARCPFSWSVEGPAGGRAPPGRGGAPGPGPLAP